MISSQLHRAQAGFDEIIQISDEDYFRLRFEIAQRVSPFPPGGCGEHSVDREHRPYFFQTVLAKSDSVSPDGLRASRHADGFATSTPSWSCIITSGLRPSVGSKRQLASINPSIFIGKACHKHLDGRPHACRFVSIDPLLAELLPQVERSAIILAFAGAYGVVSVARYVQYEVLLAEQAAWLTT